MHNLRSRNLTFFSPSRFFHFLVHESVYAKEHPMWRWATLNWLVKPIDVHLWQLIIRLQLYDCNWASNDRQTQKTTATHIWWSLNKKNRCFPHRIELLIVGVKRRITCCRIFLNKNEFIEFTFRLDVLTKSGFQFKGTTMICFFFFFLFSSSASSSSCCSVFLCSLTFPN